MMILITTIFTKSSQLKSVSARQATPVCLAKIAPKDFIVTPMDRLAATASLATATDILKTAIVSLESALVAKTIHSAITASFVLKDITETQRSVHPTTVRFAAAHFTKTLTTSLTDAKFLLIATASAVTANQATLDINVNLARTDFMESQKFSEKLASHVIALETLTHRFPDRVTVAQVNVFTA